MNAEELRAAIGHWPGVTEDIKWGSDLVFSVGGKMFCVLDTGGSACVSFKVEDGRFLELTDRPGIIPAPYLARAKWISVSSPGALTDVELASLLRSSYELVRARLTKAVQRQLGA